MKRSSCLATMVAEVKVLVHVKYYEQTSYGPFKVYLTSKVRSKMVSAPVVMLNGASSTIAPPADEPTSSGASDGLRLSVTLTPLMVKAAEDGLLSIWANHCTDWIFGPW